MSCRKKKHKTPNHFFVFPFAKHSILLLSLKGWKMFYLYLRKEKSLYTFLFTLTLKNCETLKRNFLFCFETKRFLKNWQTGQNPYSAGLNDLIN